jgi:hypothetical protein
MKTSKQQQHHVGIYLPCSPTNTDETFPDDQSLDELEEEDNVANNNNNNNNNVVPCSNSLSNLDPSTHVQLNNDKTSAARKYERFQHWKDHTYAVGLAPITWSDISDDEEQGRISDFKQSMLLSRILCRYFGRVGNMVVLKERKNWLQIPTLVNERNCIQEDPPNSSIASCSNIRHMDTHTTYYSLVLGPYWPVLMFVTLPVITLSSILVALYFVYKNPWFTSSPLSQSTEMGNVYWIIAFIAVWTLSTMGLYLSLLYTSLVDPGILPRFTERPDNSWRWNDQGQSYIPPRAVYEPDCKVVIDEYHHTCIFTGTAIGRNNVKSFFCFVFFATVRFVLDLCLVLSSIVL